MALTHSRCMQVAARTAELSSKLNDLYYEIKDLLGQNSHLSIDWGAQQTPEYLTVAADGNLDGATFTRQEVSNAIGSLDSFITLMDQGHLGNIDKLAAVEQ